MIIFIRIFKIVILQHTWSEWIKLSLCLYWLVGFIKLSCFKYPAHSFSIYLFVQNYLEAIPIVPILFFRNCLETNRIVFSEPFLWFGSAKEPSKSRSFGFRLFRFRKSTQTRCSKIRSATASTSRSRLLHPCKYRKII